MEGVRRGGNISDKVDGALVLVRSVASEEVTGVHTFWFWFWFLVLKWGRRISHKSIR